MWALLAGCWPWITPPDPGIAGDSDETGAPSPDTDTDVAVDDTDAPDTDVAVDDTDGVDTDPADSDAPAVVRATVTWEQLGGAGGSWSVLHLCVDGYVSEPWTTRLVDRVGDCHLDAALTSCADGAAAEVTAWVGGAGEPLAWNPGLGRHDAQVDPIALTTSVGIEVAAWPSVLAAGRTDGVLQATPWQDPALTEGAPGTYEAPLLVGDADVTVRFTPTAGAFAYLRLVGQGSPFGVVRCVVDASTGSLSVPAALFSGWEAEQDVSMSFGLVRGGDTVRSGGVRWVGIDLHTVSGWATTPPSSR